MTVASTLLCVQELLISRAIFLMFGTCARVCVGVCDRKKVQNETVGDANEKVAVITRTVIIAETCDNCAHADVILSKTRYTFDIEFKMAEFVLSVINISR